MAHTVGEGAVTPGESKTEERAAAWRKSGCVADDPSLNPYKPRYLEIGLYRVALGPAIDVRHQRELLTQLYTDFPTLNQTQGGVQFVDAYRGRTLIIDQAHMEALDEAPESFDASVSWMRLAFEKSMGSISFRAPYRVKVTARGTIQALGVVDPPSVLNARFPWSPSWFNANESPKSAVRYVLEDGACMRDIRIEPWFSDLKNFWLDTAAWSGPEGFGTVAEAVQFAQREAEQARELVEKIVHDLVREA